MTQQLQVYAPTEMWQGKELDLIKKQVVPNDTTDEELLLFFKICKHAGLDPFTKQIYAIRRSKKLSIETSINGYRLIAHNSHDFAGVDEAEYDTETAKHPNWARVTVYRMVQGQRQPFTAKVRWDEFQACSDATEAWKRNNWDKMPYHMLAKVAESHALRKAFQERLTAIYTSDEMDQAGYVDATSVTVTEQPQTRYEEEQEQEQQAAPPRTLAQLQGEIAQLCEQFGIDNRVIKHWRENLGIKATVPGLTALVEYLLDKPSRAVPYVYTWGMRHLITPDTLDHLFATEIQHKEPGVTSWLEFWQKVQQSPDDWAAKLADLASEVPQPAA
jgi:phage recombination protein Bet